MRSDFVLIKEIVILDPPTYYAIKKVKKSREAGEDVFDKHYLTANLFYIQNVSYHVVSKIIYDCKKFLRDAIGELPEIEKMSLEFEYHSTKDIDLDNKSYFWRKLFMDVLKTPTTRQIENSKKKNKEIITTNTIKDDNTKCYVSGKEEYFYGEHKMIFRIFGVVKSSQETLDLFFVKP
jgi:hypothetical protein